MNALVMHPTHTLWTLTGAFGVCAATHPAVEQGALFTAVALTWAMVPDSSEKIAKHRILDHRGPTHRWWALALVAVLVIAVTQSIELLRPYTVPIAGGAILGYGMHLWADLWTKSGMIGRRLPHGLRIRTGGPSEFIFAFLPALALSVLLAYSMLPPSAQAFVRDIPAQVSAAR